MFELLSSTINDPRRLGGIALALAVFATLVTIAFPFLERDRLAERMKAVNDERLRLRARERARARADAIVRR